MACKYKYNNNWYSKEELQILLYKERGIDKYGKLVKPEIKTNKFNKGFLNNIIKRGYVKADEKQNLKENYNVDILDSENSFKHIEKIKNVLNKDNIAIQPTQTKDNLKESIESVRNKNIKDYLNFKTLSGNTLVFKDDGFEDNKIGDTVTYKNAEYKIIGEEKENSEFPSQWILQVIEKEYNEQALINTKISKLKEVAKKYPRSLIRSEVRPINSNPSLDFTEYELPFQKVSGSSFQQFQQSLNKPNTNPILQGNQTNIEEIITQLEKAGALEIDCKGKLKAEKGLVTSFVKGGKWKVIKDLKGYPTHKEGGVDLTIGKDGVKIKNGNSEFTAKHGLVIPKN